MKDSTRRWLTWGLRDPNSVDPTKTPWSLTHPWSISVLHAFVIVAPACLVLILAIGTTFGAAVSAAAPMFLCGVVVLGVRRSRFRRTWLHDHGPR